MKSRFILLLLAVAATFSVQAYAQDASLYLKYAQKGDVDAMYSLAGCYWSGTGGANQNYSYAAYWYEKAAKKNNPVAMHMTAYCYLYGVGVIQSWKTAWNYAEKSIKKGCGASNWIKAQIYKEGYMSNASGGYTRFLLEAAESGYGVAQTELGLLYLYGSSEYRVTQNNKAAFNWFMKAADNEDAKGIYYLGYCYENGIWSAYGSKKNHNKAMENYLKAAKLGNADAQAEVGYAYLVGDTVERDYSTAYNYLKAAADKGNAAAYGHIGDMYYFGAGYEINYNTAMDMYKKAAELGDAYSMCQLAYMYGYGQGASQDNALMFKFYKQAADLNYAAGQHGLAYCYLYGYGVTKNAYTAFSWYKKAADQDYGASLHSLAVCYLYGNGTTKDVGQYFVYLKKAANTGNVVAMEALAIEYYIGANIGFNGIDLAKAVEWFKKAADNGDAYSQALLGYSYFKGEELFSSKDYVQAFSYLLRAVNNSDFESLDDPFKAEVYKEIAVCYRYGRGTDSDQSLASYYTELSAKYGNSDSQKAVDILRKSYDDSESAPPSHRPETSSTSSLSNQGNTTSASPVLSKEDILNIALQENDYEGIIRLADSGYQSAYIYCAKYFLKEKNFPRAYRYAQMAKSENCNVSEANSIIIKVLATGYSPTE